MPRLQNLRAVRQSVRIEVLLSGGFFYVLSRRVHGCNGHIRVERIRGEGLRNKKVGRFVPQRARRDPDALRLGLHDRQLHKYLVARDGEFWRAAAAAGGEDGVEVSAKVISALSLCAWPHP